MRRPIAITMLAVSVVLSWTLASAAQTATIPTLTEPQARSALVRELSTAYDIPNPTIACNRVSRIRMRCSFEGLTPSDVIQGNERGWSGYATVTRYRTRVVANVTNLNWTGGLPGLPPS